VNDKRTEVERNTYNILAFFGDFGGLYDFFIVLFGLLASSFSSVRLDSLIANTLYSWKLPESQKKLKAYSDIHLEKVDSTDSEIKVP
jgi:hypothetical protein